MSATPPRPSITTRMPKGAKRPKASRACLACRKLKARCEPSREAPVDPNVDASTSTPLYICHRCKTLCLDCSYETAEGQVVAALPVSEGSSSSGSSSSDTKSNKSHRASDSSFGEDVHSGNPRAVVLAPGITPRALLKPLYRRVHLTGLQRSPREFPERFLNVAGTLARLIGRRSEMKPEAVEYLNEWFDVQEPMSPDRYAHISASLCAGKRAIAVMERHYAMAPDPVEDIEYLKVALQPFETRLFTLYTGIYAHYAPMLSIPISSTGSLRACSNASEVFKLLAAYLVALPHLDDYPELVKCRKPLRRAVDALLRRSLHTPSREADTIFALHCCATNLLYPVDGFVVDSRPFVSGREEDDGLLQFARDLNSRAALITASTIAYELGYHQDTQALKYLRVSHERALGLGHEESHAKHIFQRAIERVVLWIGLQQTRTALDLAEDRLEWDSLQQFEKQVPRIDAKEVLQALHPIPTFLTPRERSRCLWVLKRAQLYDMTMALIDLRPGPGVLLDRKYAEKRSTACKDAFDEWRSELQEDMRAPSLAFRNNDPSGLALHRFFTQFTTMENLALHSLVGHGYYREIIKDSRKRSDEVYSPDGQIWKSAPAICCRQDDEPLFPAFLLNYSFSQNTSKFLGMSAVLCPSIPQVYDFVSWEPTTSTEIPGPSLLALPNFEAGLFALPILMSAEVRLPVIESWAHAASHFNPFLLSLVSSYVKTLRSMHVSVELPGVLKMRFSAANATADLLQGPLEMLMRNMAAGELSLDDPHLESVLGSSFSILAQFQQMDINAKQVRKNAPDVLLAVMDPSAPGKGKAAKASAAHGSAQNGSDTEDDNLYDTVNGLTTQIFGRDSLKGDVRSRSTQNSVRDKGSPYSGHVASPSTSVESTVGTQRSPRVGTLTQNKDGPAVVTAAAVSSSQTYQPLSPEALGLPVPMLMPVRTPISQIAIAATASSSASMQDRILHAALPTPSVLSPDSNPYGTPVDPTAAFDFLGTAYGPSGHQEELSGVQLDVAQARAQAWLQQEREQAPAPQQQVWQGSYSMPSDRSTNGSSTDAHFPASAQARVAPLATYMNGSIAGPQAATYAPPDFGPQNPNAGQNSYHQPYGGGHAGRETGGYADAVVFAVEDTSSLSGNSQPVQQHQQQQHQQQQHQQQHVLHHQHDGQHNATDYRTLSHHQQDVHHQMHQQHGHFEHQPQQQQQHDPGHLHHLQHHHQQQQQQQQPRQVYAVSQPFLEHVPAPASLHQYRSANGGGDFGPPPVVATPSPVSVAWHAYNAGVSQHQPQRTSPPT